VLWKSRYSIFAVVSQGKKKQPINCKKKMVNFTAQPLPFPNKLDLA